MPGPIAGSDCRVRLPGPIAVITAFGSDDGDEQPQTRYLDRHGVDVLGKQLAGNYVPGQEFILLRDFQLFKGVFDGQGGQERELAGAAGRVING